MDNEQAQFIVDDIIAELSGRKGFDAVLDDMDEGIFDELHSALVRIAESYD